MMYQTAAKIHPDTAIGGVALTVADLKRSLHFYQDVLGFQLLEQTASTAVLGAGATPLLRLNESPGAMPKPERAVGLYHFAILVPTRADLARSIKHLADMHNALDGRADHLVSEAFYLHDPDGNGIEIYRDRARSEWPRQNGRIRMASDPIDMPSLAAELARDARPWQGLPAGTRIGHVHLQVADLIKTEAFYAGVLGFEVMSHWPGALFVSAGGYHHHLGLNTWNSAGGSRPPASSAGLEYYDVQVPDATELQEVAGRLRDAGIAYSEQDGILMVQDPWGNSIHITALH